MLIIITLDFVSELDSAYREACHRARLGKSLIVTSCRSMFKFHLVDSGYEVVALYRDGRYCRLTELLSNSYPYTNKNIRRAHSSFKLLSRGVITCRPKDDFSNSCLNHCGERLLGQGVLPNKMVEIYLDYVPYGGLSSYEESSKLREMGLGFRTSSLELFKFDLLDEGYSVIALKKSGGFCDLGEFLSNKFPYMPKEIRRSHDASVFLISDAISFRCDKL